MFAYYHFLFIISLLDFLLAGFVYFQNKRNIINISFVVLSLFTAFWVFGVWLFLFLPVSASLSVFSAKLLYFSGVNTGLAFYFLSIFYPARRNIKLWRIILPSLLFPILFYIYFFTDYIIAGTFLTNNFAKGLIFGPLKFLFDLQIWSFFIIAFFEIFKKYRYYKGKQEQLHLKYLILGTYSVVVIAFATNVIFPIFGQFKFLWVGAGSSSIWLAMMAYAIFRHRLMGIRFVVRLGTIYTVLFSAVIFAYVFFISFLSRYIPGVFAFIIPSIIITLGFTPLKNFVETASDKIFFRKHYKFSVVVNEVEKIIHMAGLNMDRILANFNWLVIDSLKIEKSAILILIPKDHFVSRQVIGENIPFIEIKFDNPIVSYLNLHKDDILDIDELKGSESADKEIMKGEMEKTGFSLAVPIKAKNDLIGIYLLGEKRSQDQYEKEDIDLLKHVCGEVGSAIDNARMFEELKVLDRAKSEFISVVSHQMRTPISIIRWNLEMVSEEDIPVKERNKMLEVAHDRIVFLGHQIDQLLTALEIEEGKMFMDKKPADMNFLIEKAIKEAEKEIKNKGIKLKILLVQPAPLVECDIKKIEMVLKTMIGNIATYASAGGEATVTSSLISFEGRENFIVSIKDNSIGINDTDKANIFKKFFRSDAAKRTSPNGLGLGLFISKRFIEAHGGSIWVESEGEGKGSAFDFSIPVK